MTKRTKWTAGNRRTAGRANKTEQAFVAEVLETAKQAGEVLGWAYEPLTFKLGKAFSYTPDYVVHMADGSMVVWEVKGSGGWLNESSRPRWKAAAESWAGGAFVFRSAVKQKKRDGGGWKLETYERVNPWP